MRGRLSALAALLAAAGLFAIGPPAGRAQAQSLALCGNPGPAPAVQHVVLVMMENQSYDQVVGSPNAPFQTSLASQCGVAPDYFGATHTSAANYLAVSAGEYPAASPPGCGSVSGCADASDNLYNQLSGAGLSWGAFIEAMPSACDRHSGGGSVNGHDEYKIGHNPPIFYTGIPAAQCAAYDVGVPDLTAPSGAFWADLQNQTLPSFSFVTPDASDDAEAAGSSVQNAQAADAFLQKFTGLVQASPSYQAGNTVVLIAYDEGSGRSDYATGENCASQSLDLPVVNGVSANQESCHVPMFVVYPYTPAGDTDASFFDHYSITRTVEDLFGLPPLASAATAATLVGHFGIPPAAASQAPTVSIAQPANASTVSGTVTVSGSAATASTGIAQVQVSVDGGSPQTAAGTTSWSAAIDTTQLSIGRHTITVTATDQAGHTGSASVTVTVSNAVATSCPATPAGVTELSGNVSLETSQSGWTGVYNSASAVTRVQPPGGSYDGSWALQVAPKPGDSGTAGANNANPIWVPGPPGTTTTAGQAFTGSAFVDASSPGEQISLIVRETTPGGTGVGYHTTTITATGAGWQQISAAYTAKNTGDVIRYSLYATNFASSSQDFLADCLSLQTP